MTEAEFFERLKIISSELLDHPLIIFGQDEYLCFEIVYRVLTHWMSFLFEEFPLPNSKFLQNMYEILEVSDPEMIRFIKTKNITFTKLAWSLLETLFTANLPK